MINLFYIQVKMLKMLQAMQKRIMLTTIGVFSKIFLQVREMLMY